jgi:hypothetical protein
VSVVVCGDNVEAMCEFSVTSGNVEIGELFIIVCSTWVDETNDDLSDDIDVFAGFGGNELTVDDLIVE